MYIIQSYMRPILKLNRHRKRILHTEKPIYIYTKFCVIQKLHQSALGGQSQN